MVPGDRIHIKSKSQHPWAGETGELVAFENYGPAAYRWKGWRVRLDNGTECYVSNVNDLQKLD